MSGGPHDRVRAEWDAAAATFDQQHDHGLASPTARDAWWRALTPLLPPAPARVADLGCGTGTMVVLLSEHGYEVTGVDLSPLMIQRARTKARAAGRPVRLEVGDVADPALAPGEYDVVFARHVVWALPDPRQALDRWSTLLAPAGRFVLVEGRWDTGTGLRPHELRRLVEPVAREVDVLALTDPALWGREVSDERYALVGRT